MVLNLQSQPSLKAAAIDSNGLTLTYGDICSLCNQLKNLIKKKSLVFVLAQNNIGSIAWIISLIETGNVPLVLNAAINPELLERLIDTYHPSYICHIGYEKYTAKEHPLAEAFEYTLIESNLTPYPLHPELSHLLSTSGSTGSPKLVRHSYDNIRHSAKSVSTFFQLTQEDRPLLGLPIYYTMGLSIVFSHLYVGATILITNQGMTSPTFWDFTKQQQATSITGVPFSFEILDKIHFYRMKLPSLKLLTQGGGKLRPELNQKFVHHCQNNNIRWIATYGQTEGTARMAYLAPEYALQKMGSIGKAIPGGEFFLIDKKGNQITTPNTNGQLCYRGKNVTWGYSNSGADLNKGDENKGEIHTGDIAYQDADGFYFIVGRSSRFIKLFGNRIALDECEEFVKKVFKTECACIGSDSNLTIYITQDGIAQEVKNQISKRINIISSAITIRQMDELPRNDAGKILYNQLQDKNHD